jgi:flagellar hook-length control protein FliK
VLRLQPAELGSLKLDLKIEGDRVQAHLHAQTHQVQEVLERNLPQLRSALAEQGLKIDQFLVNVDQRQAEGQFDGQAQYQHQGSERRSDWNQQDHVNEEQMIPLAHLMQNGGGGISLHV